MFLFRTQIRLGTQGFIFCYPLKKALVSKLNEVEITPISNAIIRLQEKILNHRPHASDYTFMAIRPVFHHARIIFGHKLP